MYSPSGANKYISNYNNGMGPHVIEIAIEKGYEYHFYVQQLSYG